ncbi:MAG: NtrC-family two-component system response regulator AlgB [Verrucomicrobiales bacterium]|jgi:NtrC-family two-component system response regulator AlgB
MDVLIVDDEKSIRDSTMIAIESEDHYAEAVDGGRIALLRLQEADFDLVLLDLQLGDESGLDVLTEIQKRKPNLPVVIFTANATIETAVEATRKGALEYLQKPFTPDQLRRVMILAQKFRKMEHKIEELQTVVTSQSPTHQFEANDPSMKEAFSILFRAAPTPATILILGESGTGKSVVARAIHERSHLKDKPFVTVSCPSLSKELLESELFGHVKGSFTGAVQDKWGKVKAAEGGTLFLDEIGELPIEIQPKLLRLLQEREYERLGDTKTYNAEVRVIAATNRDLKQAVADGEFREDLFYRLNVIAVDMPSLRARPGDLLSFAESYLDFFAGQIGRELDGFSREALAFIRQYEWPGNLRELRNAIERAVILAEGNEIQPKDLPIDVSGSGGAAPSNHGIHVGAHLSLEELEKEHIRRVVATSESLADAAETLGIDQATLYRKRKKMNLG